MKLALLCSGQGLQTPGMFALTGDAPAAAPVFAATTDLLDHDPRAFVETAGDALFVNRASQILCVTQALAVHACLADALPDRLVVAGYSVGEVAAWGIAGVWDVAQTLAVVGARAEAMDAASTGDARLGFVRGLSRATVEALAARHKCEIAIVSPDLLFVVGGQRSDLSLLTAEATTAGAARAGLLAVHIASHTSALHAAVAPFAEVLAATTPRRPKRGTTLLSAIDGATIFDPVYGAATLAAQVGQAIDWAAVLAAMVEAGVDTVLELGPGAALATMVRTSYPALRVRAFDDFRSLDGVRDWLG
jgi:[acyl-carrier-protein] S-malonyltransferase